MLRRDLLTSALALGAVACARGRRANPTVADARSTSPLAPPPFATLETLGRLGVALFDTGDGSVVGHRADERFAMCSTFKLPLAAMVLERAAAKQLDLDTRLRFDASALVAHAPIAAELLEQAKAAGRDSAEISIGDAARAGQLTSDNAAANLLIGHLGGPTRLTEFCRAHGDPVTRLDRLEPLMNLVEPGDVRDTTSPRAMATLVARLLGTNGLPAAERATLRGWMIETKTGAQRLRAGLPADWIAGDKTGTGGGEGSTTKINDVAWIEPPGRAPVVVAAYYDVGEETEDIRDEDVAVLASVGRMVAERYGATR